MQLNQQHHPTICNLNTESTKSRGTLEGSIILYPALGQQIRRVVFVAPGLVPASPSQDSKQLAHLGLSHIDPKTCRLKCSRLA